MKHPATNLQTMALIFSFFITFFCVSCSDEDLFSDIFEEPQSQGVGDKPGKDEDAGEEGQAEEPSQEDPTEDYGEVDEALNNGETLAINTDPCDFDLSSVGNGETVSIACTMDLKGQTVIVPSNVTLKYDGGQIINGSLSFSGGWIDGKLLNKNLEIKGNAQLTDPNFLFFPERWQMVQGKTDDAHALANRLNIQQAIDLSKRLGAEVFTLGKMDAYFKISGEWGDSRVQDQYAISIPSNFHFNMGSNTTLRVEPNNWPVGSFLSVYEKNNVVISGGHLIGDRYAHDYSPIVNDYGISRSSHEWPGLVVVSGSKDVILEGVSMSDSTADNFIAGSASGHRTNPNTPYNSNIIVRNCIMKGGRRNNISVTDGKDIRIEGCMIADAGQGESITDSNGAKIYSSAGVAPKVGLDVEPFRGMDSNGNTVDYEKVENLIITGCRFVNNKVASIVEYSGVNTTIDGNFSDNCMVASYSTGTKFLNNTIEASEVNRSNRAIETGNWIVQVNGVERQLAENNVVQGNIIKGFVKGIVVNGKNGTVSDNKIYDFVSGIWLNDATDFTFDGNIMDNKNRETYSHGIYILNVKVSNLTFNNQDITVNRTPVYIKNVTNSGSIVFSNSTFKSLEGYPIIIRDIANVTVSNSLLINTSIETSNTLGFKQSGNSDQ